MNLSELDIVSDTTMEDDNIPFLYQTSITTTTTTSSSSLPSTTSSTTTSLTSLTYINDDDFFYKKKFILFKKLKPWIPIIIWGILSIITLLIFLIYNKEILLILDKFSNKIKSIGIISGIIIFYFMIFLTTFPLIIGYSTLITLSGYIFGFFIGFIISYLAALTGAITVFYFSRKLFKNSVIKLLNKNKSMRAIVKAVEKKGFKLLFLIRLAPYPYNLSNTLLSVTHLSLKTFIGATALSLFKLMIHVWIGSKLSTFSSFSLSSSTSSTTSSSSNIKENSKIFKTIIIIIGISIGIGVIIYVWISARKIIKEFEQDNNNENENINENILNNNDNNEKLIIDDEKFYMLTNNNNSSNTTINNDNNNNIIRYRRGSNFCQQGFTVFDNLIIIDENDNNINNINTIIENDNSDNDSNNDDNDNNQFIDIITY